MSDAVSNAPHAFPVRFRGYDRAAVDEELHQLRAALDHVQSERDRALARALALETQTAPPTETDEASQVSATVQWLIDTAEQDAQAIRRSAEQEATSFVEQAERLLRQRVELIEQAQHEADVCRAQASAEARSLVHDALEQANALIHNLRESEAALRTLFTNGGLAHRMPPPRRPDEHTGAHQAPANAPVT